MTDMENKCPAISVVMCTYNGEKYVAAQLESILAQDYANIEIVILDDASKDETVNIIRAYAEKDKRIKFFVNETNLGFNRNFEQALKLATSQWLAIADQDDIWMPHKLRTLYELIDEGSWLLHSYNAEFIENDLHKAVTDRSRIKFEGKAVSKLFFNNTITGHTILMHKNLLQQTLPFPEHGYYDWWLGVNAAVYSRVKLKSEALVFHRQHIDNTSRFFNHNQTKKNKEAFFKERLQMLESFASIKALEEKDSKLLKEYVQLIRTQWNKDFSLSVFLFFLKHARTAFYFRRKRVMPWYYFKYSFLRATLKIKHWV